MRVCHLGAPLALALTACGGGNRSAAPIVTPPPERDAALSLEAQSLPLDTAQSAHLQMRTRWAISPEVDRTIQNGGLSFYLSAALSPAEEPALEAEASTQIPYPLNPTGPQLSAWWLHLMSKTTTPFRDVMAMFWHDHFALSHGKFNTENRHLVRGYVQRLRRQGMGNFRTLVADMLSDGAMQVWLDGVASSTTTPNENLARELLERFTLGVDNGYTQRDIQEAARALTGFKYEPYGAVLQVVFAPDQHDGSDKTIFGRTGPFDPASLVDLIFAERDPAKFIARKLFEHFCYPEAPQQVVDDLAAVLRSNGYELRPTLDVLLRSRAFYSAKSRRSHVKAPLEAAIGFLRALDLPFEPVLLDLILTELGHRPADPPDVGGWPDGDAWLTPGGLSLRARLLHAIAADRENQNRLGVNLLRLLPLASQRTPVTAVTALAARLGLELDETDIATYAEYLNTRTRTIEGELHTSADPFRFDLNDHVTERLRGLLFLLSQHPSYLLR